MKDNNVIDLAVHRARTPSEAQQNGDRSKEAIAVLDQLRHTKRIAKEDQPVLVRNLGDLIARLEPGTSMLLAEKILQPDLWAKRKRYIRFHDDAASPSARHAASGGTFARIIDGLIDEKVRKGIDRPQAIVETVYGALKGTSFRRPARFQIQAGVDDSDATYFVREIEKVFDKLAQEVDLADHFELVSRYAIYPDCPYWWSSHSLALSSKEEEPNDIYHWDWLTDEDEFDLQIIPWWAPRCVVGHLYIPFQTSCLHLPEQGVSELKKACGVEVTPDTWTNNYSELLEPFLTSQCTRPRTIYHRLPLLLAALPRPEKLVPCLYVATSRPTGFQPEEWLSYNHPIVPCFVGTIGHQISDDGVFFQDSTDDEYKTFYVSVEGASITIAGSGVDDDLWEFRPDLYCLSSADELPDWLDPHPVQRLLKLTMDSDTAKHFALSPRNFPGRWFGEYDYETVFRPRFPDSSMLMQLRRNTIGGYLLRNFADTASIFDELKNDARDKIAASKELIDKELSKFQDAFDRRYGK